MAATFPKMESYQCSVGIGSLAIIHEQDLIISEDGRSPSRNLLDQHLSRRLRRLTYQRRKHHPVRGPKLPDEKITSIEPALGQRRARQEANSSYLRATTTVDTLVSPNATTRASIPCRAIVPRRRSDAQQSDTAHGNLRVDGKTGRARGRQTGGQSPQKPSYICIQSRPPEAN